MRREETSRDLEQELTTVEEMLSEEILSELTARGEEEVDAFHFSLGLWMRNRFIFKRQRTLAPILTALDKEAGAVVCLRLLWRHLKGRELDVTIDPVLHAH